MKKNQIIIEIDDKELNKQIEAALKRNPRETARALMDCTLNLATEAVLRTPVESGELRNSGHGVVNGVEIVRGVKNANQPAEVTQTSVAIPAALKSMGYVKFSGPYALRQHEDLSLRHDRTDGYKRSDGSTVNMVAGGEAKYLEKAFEENKEKYIERFKKIPEEALK